MPESGRTCALLWSSGPDVAFDPDSDLLANLLHATCFDSMWHQTKSNVISYPTEHARFTPLQERD